MQKKRLKYSWFFLCFLCTNFLRAQTKNNPWTVSQANEWYASKGWLRGSDFIVSSAVNQLEMWQESTFDSEGIDRELGYAQSIGLNCMRVFLHHVAWQQDKVGFKKRLKHYLSIAHEHGIATIFVFFDDCWNPTYQPGLQPAPKIGVHNSGWLRDPGALYDEETLLSDTLQLYVKDIITTFKKDKRVLLWDLYNEPGNSGYGIKSLPLLKKIFDWARSVHPTQPLSAGLWNQDLTDMNSFQLSHSDIITYHNYQDSASHHVVIDTLRKYGRPLICTEYMARTKNSTFATVMPLLKKENVGAINWGLVDGKTNTKYAWDTPMPTGEEPKVWFHDIFRKDGTPYKIAETDLIKELTGVNQISK